MERIDKVQLVVDKCGVTFEEARDALERNDYDTLDAIVDLERRGKAKTSSAHHTTTSEAAGMSCEMVQAQRAYEQSSRKTRFSEAFERVMGSFKRICMKGLEVSFVVERDRERVLSMPTLVLAILVLFLFPATIPLLIVGLFFGFRYHFEGLEDGKVNVNDVMDKVADGAQSIREDVLGS